MTEQSASLKSVYVTMATCATFAAAYGLAGLELSPLPILFITAGPLVSVVIWLQNDARLRRFATVHDWGLLAYVLWPVLVPWYVFKTRGTRAWRMSLGLLAAVLAPSVVFAVGRVWHVVLGGRVR
jgi:hypothetical protein